MKKNRSPRLRLHRETLRVLDPKRLPQGLAGAATPERGSANGCTAPTKLTPCSEAPDKCWLTDPSKDEPCSAA